MSFDDLRRFCVENNIACREKVGLARHCTFRIGGEAALFIEPESERQAAAAVAAAAGMGVKLMALGNGSNVLFSDEGYNGAILRVGKGFDDMSLIDGGFIRCGAGVPVSELAKFALEHSLSGLEFAYGIPGSVGGGVYMNAGAYGGEMKDVLVETRHITSVGEVGALSGGRLKLSYRHSAYCENGHIITQALFRLTPGDEEEIRFKMNDYMTRRREKQPLDMPSAGSVFRRPEGGYASELIDRCGLKGRRVGGAVVSEKHAGFIVNAGGASCADVLDLIRLIQDEVKAKTGVFLEREVRVIAP